MMHQGRLYARFGGVVVIAAVIVVACLVAAGLMIKVRQHLRQSALTVC